MSPWIYALLAAELVWLGATVFLLVLAFRTSLKWGFFSFLVPFGTVVYAIRHWSGARLPFLVALLGYVGVVAIVATQRDALLHSLPPRFAHLTASLHGSSASGVSPNPDFPATSAGASLRQRDELLEREAAYTRHLAELNATYAQLSSARVKLKGGGPALASYNTRLVLYQRGVADLQSEKAAYDALQRNVEAADAAVRAARQAGAAPHPGS